MPQRIALSEKEENKTQYAVFIDHRFSREASIEFEELFPNAIIEPYKRKKDIIMFKATFPNKTSSVKGILDERESIFLDFALPIDAVVEYTTGSQKPYEQVIPELNKVLKAESGKIFKLEVENADARLDLSAKSIEVLLSKRMMELGFVADLKKPEVIVYIVFLKESALIGHKEATSKILVLDSFRESNNGIEPTISRAEFKMEEAIRFFGIDLSDVRQALDIGAAPGGWTHYLSGQGIKVVAVDNGLLSYEKFDKNKRILILADESEIVNIRKMLAEKGLNDNVRVSSASDFNAYANAYDVVHIKANLYPREMLVVLQKFGKFDMLTIDTNTPPSDSAKIADSLAPLLNPNASLVMTTKLITKEIKRHIGSVNKGLSKSYHSIQFKKLPHNRRELTVHAIL